MNDQNNTVIIDDRETAAIIKAKPATIRGQRFKRRKGLDHWFTVDPVMIGSLPRYRKADVLAFVEAQIEKQPS